MIVNPVRYGSEGMVKTTTVSITGTIMLPTRYCVQNGKVIRNPKSPFQADAGSMLVLIGTKSTGRPSVNGATQAATDGDVFIYLVNA